MAFRICSLVSGSSGNSYYVEGPDGALLIDAGMTGKRLAAALRAVGGRPERVRGVLVTHDHGDHVQGAGVWHRKYRWPLFMSEGTWRGAAGRLGKVERPQRLRAGDRLALAGLAIECHATPHDGTEPLCFVVERDGKRCGVLTDLGHVFAGLGELVASLDGVFLESNYHLPLLMANPAYPPPLKRRIRSAGGHLENGEAGELLRDHAGDRLRAVVLSHLSENNNRPELALREVAARCGARLKAIGAALTVAPRHDPGGWLAF